MSSLGGKAGLSVYSLTPDSSPSSATDDCPLSVDFSQSGNGMNSFSSPGTRG